MRLLRADQLRILCCHVSVVPVLLSVISCGAHVLGAEPATQRALSQSYSDLYAKPESVRASERPFIQAQAQYSGKGALVTTLRLGYSEQLIPADPPSGLNKPQRLRLRCYNGNMVGPTLRIRPGDKLAITIENELPKTENLGCMPDLGNTPHGFNCTNLHTHGLHVSPIEDDVFREIEPCGKPCTYEYHIRKDHVAGTFWYHPHKHGSVAMQVTTGSAGALIVEGGLDEIPEIRKAFERVLVIQQLKFTPDPGKVVTPSEKDVYSGPNATGIVTVTLINGQLHPVIRMRPGSVERWRFIHAGIAQGINLSLVKDGGPTNSAPGGGSTLPLYEIAVDGIPRGKMTPQTVYPFYPGYRWDVLVKAPYEPGQYFLMDQGGARTNSPAGTNTDQKAYLAKVVVTGPPQPMKLPEPYDLAACVPSQFAPITCAEITGPEGPRKCAIELAIQTNAPKFTIDKCDYLEKRIDRVAWLDRAEEWHISAGGHPFHIHVNPFEQLVYDKDHKKIVDRVWRDTLFVNTKDQAYETVRMRFKDFHGKTVLHCHFLNHEDEGMMENFLLLPQGAPPPKFRVKCAPTPVQQCDANAGVGLRLNKQAPDFELIGTDGRRHRLAHFGPGPVVVIFFRGLGCLHCVEQLKELKALEPEFRKRHAVVVGVSSDSDEVLAAAYKAYTRKQPFPFLLLADGKLGAFKAFGCWNGDPLHGTFVLDRAHRVVWQHSGAQPLLDLQDVLKQCRNLDGPSTEFSRAK